MSSQIDLAARVEVADPTLLSRTWDFITSRISEVEFEKFVFESSDALKSIFSKSTVMLFLEFNYKSKDTHALRNDIKSAISSISLPCECAKIPSSTKVDP